MIQYNEEVILKDIRKKVGIEQLNGEYYVPFDEINIDGQSVVFSNKGRPVFIVLNGYKLLSTGWFPEDDFSSG
jgi:hypothetical protein